LAEENLFNAEIAEHAEKDWARLFFSAGLAIPAFKALGTFDFPAVSVMLDGS
jgi:hypothetical protein